MPLADTNLYPCCLEELGVYDVKLREISVMQSTATYSEGVNDLETVISHRFMAPPSENAEGADLCCQGA